MGVTVREKDGAWWVFVHHQGRRKAKRIGPGTKNRDAARIAAAKIAAKLALGEFGILETPEQKPSPTFEQVAADWERVTSPNWKRGTQLTYANALRCRILPTFGTLPWGEITSTRVETWWTAQREDGLSKRRLGILRGILRAAGIRKIRPHDLRHTYATLAIQAGVPLLAVSRQLGHSSIAITADLYTHAVPGGNRAAAEALEAVLAGNQTQPPRNPAP